MRHWRLAGYLCKQWLILLESMLALVISVLSQELITLRPCQNKSWLQVRLDGHQAVYNVFVG